MSKSSHAQQLFKGKVDAAGRTIIVREHPQMKQVVMPKKTRHPSNILAYTALLVALAVTPTFAQQPGPDSLLETYTDWQVRCQTATRDDTRVRSCGMQQNLARQLDDGSRRQILSFMITPTDSGDSVVTVVTPLGVGLARGLGISFDGGIVEADYVTCTQRGCIVREQLNDAVISAFRAGDNAAVIMEIVGQGEVSLSLSLNGFDAAWQRVRELN